MALVLISGDRLAAAVSRADSALVSGEKISVKLTKSLSLLRERRDELSTKLAEAREKEEPPLMEKEDWLAMI
jgi:hypothetical protein